MGQLLLNYETVLLPKLESAITDALANEVSDAIVEVLKQSARENIYDRYTPHGMHPYERRWSYIKDESYETFAQGNTLIIKENVRGQGNAGNNLGEIIEAGTPYEWVGSDIYKQQPFPIPFFSSSIDEAINDGTIESALMRGLERQGF